MNAGISATLSDTIILEKNMTNRVGSKHQGQQRGKQERKEIKQGNREREEVKRATARAKYRNAVKGQPESAAA
ncbi:MAG: hypothetical protein ABWY05_17470 [Noviherbaspirillum sp.]